MIALIVLAVLGVLGIAGIAVLGAILFPVLAQAREAARAASCHSNGKSIAMSEMMYAQDNDLRFPPKENWANVMMPYYPISRVTMCPTANRQDAYAMNSWHSSRPIQRIVSPAAAPLFFESSLFRRSASDALQSWEPRHRRNGLRGVVAFADGHAQLLSSPPDAKAGLRR
jgi:prepilin-type processing-associated H-X9-DG protein